MDSDRISKINGRHIMHISLTRVDDSVSASISNNKNLLKYIKNNLRFTYDDLFRHILLF